MHCATLCSDDLSTQVHLSIQTMRTSVFGVYMHSSLHSLLGDEAFRAALVCQTLPPPSLVKAVNKLSIQGCTQWNGGVITWKLFLNCRKSSGNITNKSWYHLTPFSQRICVSLYLPESSNVFWLHPLTPYWHAIPGPLLFKFHLPWHCILVSFSYTRFLVSALLGNGRSQGEGKEAGQKVAL